MNDYDALKIQLKAYGDLAEVSSYGQVSENGRTYELIRLRVPGPEGAPELVITSGFHGEEPAGPLTLARHFGEVARYARERGVALRVYPCVNPSGFEAGTRYNASGEHPNNDFLRYEVSPGVWVGELERGQAFNRWRVFTEGPKETRALREELERSGAPAAMLDIHQDNYFPRPCHYAYTFGPREWYLPMVRASVPHAKVAAHVLVDEPWRTDACGFVEYHDGSVTDYFYRRGTRVIATLETTTRTPFERSAQVNLVWIRGFIELAAAQPSQK